MTRHVHRWRFSAFGLPGVLTLGLVSACGGGGTEAPAPAAAPIANPVNAATAGNVTGKVVFEGTAPAPTPLRTSADPKCQGTELMSEVIVVGDGSALQNVFVYVKDGLGDLKFPVPAQAVSMDQKGCHYIPHVFGVQVGQPVEITNSDPTLHNVHAVAHANREFNAGQPLQGMKMTHTFTTKEIMVPFKCDVHGWMNAWVGVLDHPYFSVTGKDGAFSLNGLPPGTYTVEAWHEKLGTKAQTVTIGEKESKELAFTFTL
jgi:plastocyanin